MQGLGLVGGGNSHFSPGRFMLGLLLLTPRHRRARLHFQLTRGASVLVGRCSRPLCFLLSLASVLLRWQAAARRWIISHLSLSCCELASLPALSSVYDIPVT